MGTGFTVVDTQQAAASYGSLSAWFASDVTIIQVGLAGTAYVQSGCEVTAGTNAGTLKVAAGTLCVAGAPVTVALTDNIACNSGNIDATQDRWALVEVNSGGTISVNLGGLGSLFPEPPTPTASTVCLAAVYIKHGQAGVGAIDVLTGTSNGASKIVDKRIIRTYGGGANVQLFTASGTWTKPANMQYALVICIGPGGGGGSGQRIATVTTCGGGGGGGPGGVGQQWLPASILGSTESVGVGVGGTGGAARNSNANGIAGNDGNANTIFGNNGVKVFCIGGLGQGGGGGVTAGGAGGNGGLGNVAGAQTAAAAGSSATYSNNARGGGNGANGTGATAATAGSRDAIGPGGGGGGGGQNLGLLAAAAGGAGPFVGQLNQTTSGGVAGTGVAGAGGDGKGQAATWLNQIIGGGGGGGGAGSATLNQAGGNGGNGGSFGAGGGGGGNGIGTGASGAGGNGADGACLVLSFS